MDKGNNNPGDEPEMDKYQCPETGAHFDFLDMIRRCKSLQTRRKVIDQVMEEEEQKRKQKSSESSPLKSRISEVVRKNQELKENANNFAIKQMQ